MANFKAPCKWLSLDKFYLCVCAALAPFFFAGKTTESLERADFDQRMACGAPVRWSKYTAVVPQVLKQVANLSCSKCIKANQQRVQSQLLRQEITSERI